MAHQKVCVSSFCSLVYNSLALQCKDDLDLIYLITLDGDQMGEFSMILLKVLSFFRSPFRETVA